MKRIVMLLLAVATVAAAMFSPFSVFQAKTNYDALESAMVTYNNAASTVGVADNQLQSTITEFTQNRNFEIFYGDVDSLVRVLNSVAGINVTATMGCDVTNAYTELGEYNSDVPASAVKLSLIAEDTVTALNVVNRMQLPIYRIDASEPNNISVIFLTGAGVSK